VGTCYMPDKMMMMVMLLKSTLLVGAQ